MPRFWRSCSRLLAVVLCHALMTQAVLGQQSSLRVRIVQGSGAKNVVQQIAARPLVVRVEDANGAPVADARVVFTSPQVGPSGEFSNNLRTFEAITDSRGQASADSYHPNDITGAYFIRVTAQFQNRTAMEDIRQENVGQSKGRGKLIAIIAVAGAAAAAILASSLKKDSSPTTPPTTPPTITLGGTAVGAPTP
jgi:hypothetical protein